MARVHPVDTIRNTMSLSNLLDEPAEYKSNDSEHVSKTLESPTNAVPLLNKGRNASDMFECNPLEPEDMTEADEIVDDTEREFICVNDEFTSCKTGQYTKDLSRKVISDHFGRNKACTRDITDWPLFCRKHYQRATYNKQLWQVRKINLILRQIDIIEVQYPGTTYDVNFKKSEEARLNKYSRQIAAGVSKEESAQSVMPKTGKYFEAPVDVLRELDQYLGLGKSAQEVKDIVNVIYQMLEGRDTGQIPAVEFLPRLSGKTPSNMKNSIKTAGVLSTQISKTSSRSTRISLRGSVRKSK